MEKLLQIAFTLHPAPTYPCPVCGYGMKDHPWDFNICPSCGTEFDKDNVFSTHDELRDEWVKAGMPWWSTVDPRPEGWNPVAQLEALSPF